MRGGSFKSQKKAYPGQRLLAVPAFPHSYAREAGEGESGAETGLSG